MKQLNKEANKLAAKADEAADQLGRNVVFCVLAAHTTGVGTAQQLKDKFDSLTTFPLGNSLRRCFWRTGSISHSTTYLRS
jgi:hypothetical protein